VINDAAAIGASAIGTAWGGGKDPVMQTVAHAGLGAITAKLRGQDVIAGAIGGATESVLGNLVDAAGGLPKNPDGTVSNATRAIYTAAATLAGGMVANATGRDAVTAGQTAQNSALNNYLNHTEIKKLVAAQDGCQKGDQSACQTRDQLLALDKQRDLDLKNACAGGPSSACQGEQQKVRSAYAGIIRAVADEGQPTGGGVLGYGFYASETQYQANSTLSSVDRALGTAQGFVGGLVDGIVEVGKGLGTAAAAATGNSVAQDEIAKTASSLINLADPEKVALILKNANREQSYAIADAYERGDAAALGRIGGQVLSMIPGGALGTAGKASDVAKALEKTVSAAKGEGSAMAAKEYVNILSPAERQHILFGDGPGSGGHMYPGQPGKTTFPPSWTEGQILQNVGDVVTSPTTQWYAQTGTGGAVTKAGDPARWVAWETRDGVSMRVVYEPATGRTVTAFPDSVPSTINLRAISK
jgi:filamentous hemagglutinin